MPVPLHTEPTCRRWPWPVRIGGRCAAVVALVASSLVAVVVGSAAARLALAQGASQGSAPVVTTYAGGTGLGLATTVGQDPAGVAVYGDTLYVSDAGMDVVRAVNLSTGLETTVAGDASYNDTSDQGIGGPATEASIGTPKAIAVDSAGDLFIVEDNHRGYGDILMVAARNCSSSCPFGLSSTTTGDIYDMYTFPAEVGPIAVDAQGNLYTATESGTDVVEVSASTGSTSVVAGGGGTANSNGDGGPATQASLGGVDAITFDSAGDMFISDSGSGTTQAAVRIVAASSCSSSCPFGLSSTTAGDIYTLPASTSLSQSYVGGPLVTDPGGNLYLANAGVVYEVDQRTGAVSDYAGGGGTVGHNGDGGLATKASIAPVALTFDASGNLYIAEQGGSVDYDQSGDVRMVAATSHDITTVAGAPAQPIGSTGDGGPAVDAEIGGYGVGGYGEGGPTCLYCGPIAPAVDAQGNLYFIDGNGLVREVDRTSGTVSTVAGSTNGEFYVPAFAPPPSGTPATSIDFGSGTLTSLALDPQGDLFIGYGSVSDAQEGGLTNSGVGYSGGQVFMLAAQDCASSCPFGLASTIAGDLYTVAGGGTPASGDGDGGPATSAELGDPMSVGVSPAGDLYIGEDTPGQDYGDVRLVSRSTGDISTYSGGNSYSGSGSFGDGGPATAAYLGSPVGLAFDRSGDLYIADDNAYGGGNIREVNASTRTITTIAGFNGTNFADLSPDPAYSGPALNAAIVPNGIAIDAADNIYLTEDSYSVPGGTENEDCTLREINTSGVITTLAGGSASTPLPGGGASTTCWYSGDGGPATQASLDYPDGVVVDATGDVFVADNGANRIREIAAATPQPTVAPVVTGVSPASGPGSGGTAVTITGTAFTAASTVTFGGVLATGVTLNPDGSLSATSPPGSDVADVRVSNSSGESPLSPADEFSYTPVVSKVSPGTGSDVLPTTVTITGAGFSEATAVYFGDVAAASYQVTSPTSITATDPLQAGGTAVGVTVTTPGGTSTTSNADLFGYLDEGAVSGLVLDPNDDPVAGAEVSVCPAAGTSGNCTDVTTGADGTYTASPLANGTYDIYVSPPGGTGLFSNFYVLGFGLLPGRGGQATLSSAAPLVEAAPVVLAAATPTPPNVSLTGSPYTSTTISARGCRNGTATFATEGTQWGTGVTSSVQTGRLVETPPGSGYYVGTLPKLFDGTSTVSVQFGCPASDDLSIPSVSGLSPTDGPVGGRAAGIGSAPVTVTGSGFTGATAVDFGGFPADGFSVVSDTEIVAYPPPGQGTVDVTVKGLAGTSVTSSADRYSYGPIVTSIESADGSTGGPGGGGTTVVVSGADFTGATTVDFGSKPAQSFEVVSDSELVAVSPPGSGTVGITVTTSVGTSATSQEDQFTYYAPEVTGLDQTNGPAAGGGELVVSGGYFTGATSVSFGDTPTTNFSVLNDGELEVTVPAHTAGTVDVTVSTSAGTSQDTAADHYTYDGPVVTGLSETSGFAGDPLAIFGSGLTGATNVTFAGEPTKFSVIDDHTIYAVVPNGAAGSTVNVVVTTPGGPSPTSPADLFTYNPPVSAGGGHEISEVIGGEDLPVDGANGCDGFVITGDLAGAQYVDFFEPSGVVKEPVTGPAYVSQSDGEVAVSVTNIPPGAPQATVAVQVEGTDPNDGSHWTSSQEEVSYGELKIKRIDPSHAPFVSPGEVELETSGIATPRCSATNATKFVWGNDKLSASDQESQPGDEVGEVKWTVEAPAGKNTEDVYIDTVGDGGNHYQSASVEFSYDPPEVRSVDPASGPAKGGNRVVITGTGFAPDTTKGAQGSVSSVNWGFGGSGVSWPFNNVKPTSISTGPIPGNNGKGFVTVTVKNGSYSATSPSGVSYTAGDGQYYTYVPSSPPGTGSSPTPTPPNPCQALTQTAGTTSCNPTAPIATDVYRDPSGTVENQNDQPVAGATVTLLQSTTPSGPWGAVPNGSAIMSPANRTNPQTTGTDGQYGWDVLPGYYEVSASAPNCTRATSTMLTVPPPVTGYLLKLTCSGSPPTVTSAAAPTSGPTSGGTKVTIEGSGFGSSTQVSFGSLPAASVEVATSGSSVTAVSPPAALPGSVTLTVATSGGSADAGTFTFAYPVPSISSFSPGSGLTGTVVTITGSGFTGATSVDFGTVPATQFTVVSNEQITAVAPSGSGQATVSVSTAGGTATSSGKFTFSSTGTSPTSPTSLSSTTTIVPPGISTTTAPPQAHPPAGPAVSTASPTTTTTAPSGGLPAFPGAGVAFPNGAIVHFERTYYVIAGGHAFGVNNTGQLAKLKRVDRARPVAVTSGQSVPDVPPRPGTLVTTQWVTGNTTIYVMGRDGELHGFPTMSQFLSDGYDSALVVTVPNVGHIRVGLSTAKLGPDATALYTSADGAIVDSSGTFYVLAGGRAFGVGTEAELSALRRLDRATVLDGMVTAAMKDATPASGVLLGALGGRALVSYDGGVWPFKGSSQLKKDGYGGTAAVPVTGVGTVPIVLPYSGS